MRQCRYIHTRDGKKKKMGEVCTTGTNHESGELLHVNAVGLCSAHRRKDILLQFTTIPKRQTYFGKASNSLIDFVLPHEADSMETCVHCSAKKWNEESSSLCCSNGRLSFLPPYPPLPRQLDELLNSSSLNAIAFRDNIRKYNNLLSFGSLRLKYDNRLASRSGSGVYCYRINGEVYASISESIDPQTHQPAFSELYVIDPVITSTRDELNANSYGICAETLKNLRELMISINPLARSYRMWGEEANAELQLRLTSGHNRQFSTPSMTTEIAAIMPGDGTNTHRHMISLSNWEIRVD